MALFLNGKQVRGSLIVEGDLTMPLPTVDTASGSVASFDTDLTENLIECVCTLPYNANGYNEVSLFVNSINNWDEQWEVGGYNTQNGEKTIATNRIRSKSHILVNGGEKIYCHTNGSAMRLFLYDANGDYIETPSAVTDGTYTIPSGVFFITFHLEVAYGTTYNHDISINYPSTDTEYHAFNGVVEYFNTTIYGGEIDLVTGTLTDKYNADGTEKTPVIINLNGNSITLDTENTIYNNCGDTRVKFLLTVGKKIA